MENEQKKSDNHNRIYVIIIALVLCAVAYCSMRSCGNGANIEQIHKSTDTTVDAVEAEHTNAGRELDNATGQLDSAGAAAKRADEFITASQERVAENTAGLADCQRIVGACREIIADSQRIYCEVEEANRSGTGCGS